MRVPPVSPPSGIRLQEELIRVPRAEGTLGVKGTNTSFDVGDPGTERLGPCHFLVTVTPGLQVTLEQWPREETLLGSGSIYVPEPPDSAGFPWELQVTQPSPGVPQ